MLDQTRDLEEKLKAVTEVCPTCGRSAVDSVPGLDEELKAAEEELMAAAGELARVRDELEQFTYVASHDLQEPLRMVASYTQLLSKRYKGQLDDDADTYINFAVDGANRMQKLIHDLLQYSRAGRPDKILAPMKAVDALEVALANLQFRIQETNADIVYDKESMPDLVADSTQMSQLYQNFIGNALKFCESKPVINVGSEKDGYYWHFWVQDNGIGIEPQYIERIFLIFQRLHDRESYEGTGIGLSICKKIVERHGGRLWVESTVGDGSTFHWTIPIEPVT